MNLTLSPTERDFQDEVRAFVATHFPPERPYRGDRAQRRAWADALLARGWAAYRWPVEYGGPPWTATQRFIWERETEIRGVPAQLGGMGMGMLAPVLMAHGTPEQKAQHLPGIVEDRVEWCQGYSEPGAGSDLAALSTRAIAEDDAYIVDGEKIWTSWAHIADWMFCLVRTGRDTRPQAGITFLLIDMRSPGVTVHPILTLDGQHTINRVTLEGVRVPVENRIGAENQGWTYAKALLTHERTGLAHVSLSLRLLQQLKDLHAGFGLAPDAPEVRKAAVLETELQALAISELRCLGAMTAGQAPPLASMLKLRGAEIVQEVTTLLLEAAGHDAAPWLPELGAVHCDVAPISPLWAHRETIRYFTARTASIAGGTNEVQRNIIARHVLGLP